MTSAKEVLNQPPPLSPYDAFGGDRALHDATARTLGALPHEIAELGAIAGSSQSQEWARQANENPPVLHTHDRFGHRIDEVEFHPAYHELMRVATRYGLHAAPWSQTVPHAHLERAIKFYLWAQVEAGHGCPISMTYAAVPALRHAPALAAIWEPRLCARAYDPDLRWIEKKDSAQTGMAMTEKQGGSDVRANITSAQFAENTPAGAAYLLQGHKWFCSAPMCDAFLVLAQAPEGLSCFLMPRILPDGTRNHIFIQRLKEKLGNRSNASSEIELEDAWAILVGEAGRGVQTILEMVNCTRLDCINGSAALMRAACAQAIHHAAHRSAFGKLLIDQPLMTCVLADVAIESEAAMLLLLRLAQSADAAADPQEALLKRLGTALGKFAVCKRASTVAAEALEALGGNGYVEESVMPRLYREAPLNAIWEGSGNINALDVLRIIERQPQALEAYASEIATALDDPRCKSAARALTGELRGGEIPQARARYLVERLALLWQASLLLRAQSPAAEPFIDSRIAGRYGQGLGTLAPSGLHKDIVLRAAPGGFVE